MSKETMDWLNTYTLIGFTEKRGNAWHYREGSDNHYPDAVPLIDVETRLFDWFPVQSPLHVEWGEGFRQVPDKVAVLHSGTGDCLGIFAEGYPETSYHDRLVSPVAGILDANPEELQIGSAGLLRNGAVAWIQVEVPDNVETPEGVVFRPSLLATSSLDGTIASTYKRVITNVVCDNTMAMALREKGQVYKVKNTKNSGVKLAEAREALAIVWKVADDFAAQVKALCETTVTGAQWDAFLTAHVMTDKNGQPHKEGRGLTMAENKRDALSLLWNKDERCSPWKGTAYGVVQTVNTWNTHESIVRKVTRAERNFMNVLNGKLDEQDGETLDTLNRVLVATA